MAYDAGSTQGGSSGAPLIDANSQLIVGMLSGGHASCDDPDSFDYYGRLAVVGPCSLPRYCACRQQVYLLRQMRVRVWSCFGCVLIGCRSGSPDPYSLNVCSSSPRRQYHTLLAQIVTLLPFLALYGQWRSRVQ